MICVYKEFKYSSQSMLYTMNKTATATATSRNSINNKVCISLWNNDSLFAFNIVVMLSRMYTVHRTPYTFYTLTHTLTHACGLNVLCCCLTAITRCGIVIIVVAAAAATAAKVPNKIGLLLCVADWQSIYQPFFVVVSKTNRSLNWINGTVFNNKTAIIFLLLAIVNLSSRTCTFLDNLKC